MDGRKKNQVTGLKYPQWVKDEAVRLVNTGLTQAEATRQLNQNKRIGREVSKVQVGRWWNHAERLRRKCHCDACAYCQRRKWRIAHEMKNKEPDWTPSENAKLGGFVGFIVGSFAYKWIFTEAKRSFIFRENVNSNG